MTPYNGRVHRRRFNKCSYTINNQTKNTTISTTTIVTANKS